MGLLISGTILEDRQCLTALIEGVLQDWSGNVTPEHKVACQVTESGISVACNLATEVFNNTIVRSKPGPFKRAAAVAILALYVPSFVILTKTGQDPSVQLAGEEADQWRARFAFSLIAPTLSQLTMTEGARRLTAPWSPPTPHFQIELIAWLTVLEAPFSKNLEGKQVLDVPRVCRAILALALIIEACYYDIDDDLKGKGDCCRQAVEDHRLDLEYDMPYGTIYPAGGLMPGSGWLGDHETEEPVREDGL